MSISLEGRLLIILGLALAVEATELLGIPVNERVDMVASEIELDLGAEDAAEDDLNLDERLENNDRVFPPDLELRLSSTSVDEYAEEEDVAEDVLPCLLGSEVSGLSVPKRDVEEDLIRPNLDLGALGATGGLFVDTDSLLGDLGGDIGVVFSSLAGLSWLFSGFSGIFSILSSVDAVLTSVFEGARSLVSLVFETVLERRSFSNGWFIFLVSFFDLPRNNQSTSPLLTPVS